MLKTLDHQKMNLKAFLVFIFRVICLTLLTLCFIFQYVSQSGNYSNQKVTRIDNIFSADCQYEDGMLQLKQYELSLQWLSSFKQI